MSQDNPVRVWIDATSTVLRLGIAAVVQPPTFVLAGQSCRFSPQPNPQAADVLVFELSSQSLEEAVGISAGHAIRLVAITEEGEEDLLAQAVDAGVTSALTRSRMTPEALAQGLLAVSSGGSFLPTAMVARLLGVAATGEGGRPPRGVLGVREVQVLRLLASGSSTRAIAEWLCYSEKTVKNIIHDILVQMNCKTRAQAIAAATHRNII